MSYSTTSMRTYGMAAIVALGIAVVSCVIVVWIVSFIESARSGSQRMESMNVSVRGEPIIQRHPTSMFPVQNEFVGLDGSVVEAQRHEMLQAIRNVSKGAEDGSADAPWVLRLAAVQDGGNPPTYWYLVQGGGPPGQAYGVGYNAFTKQVAGYFGRDGFVDHMPARDSWFELSGGQLTSATLQMSTVEPRSFDRVIYLLANDNLWVIDPRTKEVRSLAATPGDALLGQFWDLRPLAQQESELSKDRRLQSMVMLGMTPRLLVVRSDETALLVEPQSGETSTLHLLPEMRRSSWAGWRLPDGQLLVGIFGRIPGMPIDQLLWIDQEGNVVRRHELHLARPEGDSESLMAWLGLVAIPCPIGQLPFLYIIPQQFYANGEVDSFFAGVRRTLGFSWPALIVLMAISGTGAVAAYRRQARFQLPALAWTVFAFLFGLPGWIAYRWHRRWPPLADCPTCGQLAPRDRGHCTECGAEFSPPALKGIEVFA